ncbi:MAG: TetR/AcrR family transcriptional regulator [bacterium]|nr:TetR/AcrR family transcriptional regulator [bacterium]
MAYEVTKRVGNRAYRYRVESYRDPESGRSRGRWTYLGRLAGDQTLPPEPPQTGQTRERLLDAAARLLERVDYRRLTAGAVAREAEVAHGTFYRYFKDRSDVLYHVLERIADEAARVKAELAMQPIGTLAEERARVRDRMRSMLRLRSSHPGTIRAWFALSATDPRVGRLRQLRREQAVEEWSTYFERLGESGHGAYAASSADAARALVAMLEGCIRHAAVDQGSMQDGEIEAAAEIVERAIFGSLT